MPDADIGRAENCKRQFERNPTLHTYPGEV
jgi:hypothetical protein